MAQSLVSEDSLCTRGLEPCAAAMVAFTPMTWSSSGFWRAVGMGALGGALGGASGLVGSALGVANIGNSLGYNILSQTTSSVITNAVFGQKTDLNDVFGIVAGAAAASFLPTFKALKAKPVINTLAETGFNTVRGAASGVIRGGLDAIIHKDARYIYTDAIGGAISGGVKTLLNNAIFGAPYRTTSIEGAHSTYRTGGLANFINNKLLAKPLGEGLTLGTNMYVRQGMNDIGTMNHEGYHVYQQMEMGWTGFYGNLARDYLSNRFGYGPLEKEAYRFEKDNGNNFVW